MAEQAKAEYYQLFVGFEFPPQSYTLDSSTVALYLDATRESNDLFRKEGLVPPMAVTAFAMSSLAQNVTMPSGTIHVSQDLDFLKLVKVGDTITCYSTVSRKVDRGGLRLMNTDITVLNQNEEKVLTGRVGFVLPEPGIASQAEK
jgi:acyl dehydratase